MLAWNSARCWLFRRPPPGFLKISVFFRRPPPGFFPNFWCFFVDIPLGFLKISVFFRRGPFVRGSKFLVFFRRHPPRIFFFKFLVFSSPLFFLLHLRLPFIPGFASKSQTGPKGALSRGVRWKSGRAHNFSVVFPFSFAWTPPFSTTWIFSSFFFRLLRLPCRPGNRFEV